MGFLVYERINAPFIPEDVNSLFIDSEERQESLLVSKVLTNIKLWEGHRGICLRMLERKEMTIRQR